MKFESKYNVGDTVWVLTEKKEPCPHCKSHYTLTKEWWLSSQEITGIETETGSCNFSSMGVRVCYQMSGWSRIDEDELFPTQESAILERDKRNAELKGG